MFAVPLIQSYFSNRWKEMLAFGCMFCRAGYSFIRSVSQSKAFLQFPKMNSKSGRCFKSVRLTPFCYLEYADCWFYFVGLAPGLRMLHLQFSRHQHLPVPLLTPQRNVKWGFLQPPLVCWSSAHHPGHHLWWVLLQPPPSVGGWLGTGGWALGGCAFFHWQEFRSSHHYTNHYEPAPRTVITKLLQCNGLHTSIPLHGFNLLSVLPTSLSYLLSLYSRISVYLTACFSWLYNLNLQGQDIWFSLPPCCVVVSAELQQLWIKLQWTTHIKLPITSALLSLPLSTPLIFSMGCAFFGLEGALST